MLAISKSSIANPNKSLVPKIVVSKEAPAIVCGITIEVAYKDKNEIISIFISLRILSRDVAQDLCCSVGQELNMLITRAVVY